MTTDIETQILREVGEDLTTPFKWDGEGELREAIADGLDEACMVGEYFTQGLTLGMEANVAFYELSAVGFYPLYIKRAFLREQERELDSTSLVSIMTRDKQWQISRGAPREYVQLSPSLIMLYPCYSSDGGALELDVVGTQKHYDDDSEWLTLREELENALIHYGKYYLFMRSGGRVELALAEYQEYLRGVGAHQQLKHHKQALRQYRYQSRGESV